MSQKVKGFLATDGRFFEHEPECRRHEHAQAIRSLCDSHEVNPENFFTLLREWKKNIEGYYNADSQCKEPQALATGNIEFEPEPTELSQDGGDYEDAPSGNKDVPGFLELALRRR